MALDDFTPDPAAASETTPDAVNPLLGGEDEDLFDFPPVAAFTDDDESLEPAPELGSAPAFLEELTELPAGDVEAPPELTETGEPVQAGPGASLPADDLEPSRDGVHADTGAGAGAEDGPVEDTLRRISELGSDFDDATPSPPPPPPSPPSSPPATAPASPAPPAMPLGRAAAPIGGGSLTRVALIAASVVLLLNVGIVGVVWQSNRSFVATLLEVHAERDSRDGAPPGPAAPHGTEGQRVGASLGAAAHEPESSGLPPALPAEDEIALSLAEDEIRDGRFTAARRRLHRLLAVIDRVDEPRRAQVEARAAFRIAETYRLEAEAGEEQQ